MKFYYNGNLIRTSKTHTYTHAVLKPDGKPFACSSSLDGAKKAIQKEIGGWETSKKNCREAIKAINAGKPYCFFQHGRMTIKVSLKGETVADYEKHIQEYDRIIEKYKSYQIVELEARD